MNRAVTILLGFLTIGLVALTSCKKDDKEPQKNEGTTYVSVAINLQSSLRAGTGTTDDEFNLKGTWNGKDAIETVAVYVVGDGSVSYGQYTMADFKIVKAADDTNITIKPKNAILTKPGSKKIYALINAPAEITKMLEMSMPAHFNKAYAKAVENMTTAQVARANGEKEDVIMMSNADECKIDVEDGVSKEEAIQGTKNRAKVNVKRVVARVILTTTKDTYPIELEDGTMLGTISNITYAVAQGEKAFYISQQKNKEGLIVTPGYYFLPAVDATNPSKLTNYAEQAKIYDYSDLKATADNPRTALVAADLKSALEIGKKSLESSAFIFEASHMFGEEGQTVADYTGDFRRGNTPYVLVRTKFTPNLDLFYNDYQKRLFQKVGHNGSFYRGEDGLFYVNIRTKDKPDKVQERNVPKQKYTKFEGGKVLYHVFVNPDEVYKTLNAPAYRNNIYHISVSGFKTLGLNWNPLYPEDPDNPKDNPDPKPKGEPEPPYVPGDFNTPKETYLSVEINVIPWNVHSYEIQLTLD